MGEAIISALGVVVAALLATAGQVYKLRKENSQQHGEGRAILRTVHERVIQIDEKLDEHLRDHINWAEKERRQ